MDPLHLAIALGPLATYLIVLGAVNLSSRPHVTTGARDAAALAIGISGLVVAGPMELFLIEQAAVVYGGWIWAIMLAAYALAALLIILLMRPRLIIYNMTLEQLRPVLASVVARLDSDARWAGDGLVMPQLGVQLTVEAVNVTKNVQLVSAGLEQSVQGWHRLEVELAAGLHKSRSPANSYGFSLLTFGLLLWGTITYFLYREPGQVTQALSEMLRRS